MGRRFAGVFKDGFVVGVSSSRDVAEEASRIGADCVEDFGEAVSCSDYIFLAVPIHALASAVSRINQYVQPSTWAFDMCSARVAAAKKMSALRCKWFGLHAGGVFGEAPAQILEYLAERGHRFRPMTAEEHDKRGSVVAMVHFLGMAVESILSDSDRQILATSPAAANLLKLIDHLRNNSPDTYWERFARFHCKPTQTTPGRACRICR
jgi:prephenate dehydrogenase